MHPLVSAGGAGESAVGALFSVFLQKQREIVQNRQKKCGKMSETDGGNYAAL